MKRIFLVAIYLMCITSAFSQDSWKRVQLWSGRLIDRAGDTILTFRYPNYTKLSDINFLKLGDRWIVHGSEKKVAIPDGSVVMPGNSDSFFIIQKSDNSFGVINDKNKTLVPFGIYERIEYWKDNLFFARRKGNYWGAIDNKNNVVIPFIYNYFLPNSSPTSGLLIDAPYSLSFIDKKGKGHLPAKEITRSVLSVSDSIVIGFGQAYNIVAFDLQGDTIIPASREYKWMWPFADGYAFFQIENKLWGIVDKSGNEVVAPIYENISTNYGSRSQPVSGKPHTFTDGLACMFKDGKYGAVDKFGNIVIPFMYSGLSPFSEGVAIAMIYDSQEKYNSGFKYGVINNKGETVIPFEYDFISLFTNGYAQATKDGKMGIINIKNEVIMPFEYYQILPFNDSYFISMDFSKRESLFDPSGYLK